MDNKVILPFAVEKEYYVDPVEVEKKPTYECFKRLFDIVVSVIAIIVLVIPMIIVAIMVKSTSKGPSIFKQDRLGLNGKKIMVYKYRTMYVDAEKDGAQWSKGEEDERITPLGRKLRSYRIDELPQLWNILKGDLSIVGPRPERACFYEEFEKYIPGFKQRLLVQPGLTGHAQVNGGYELKPEEKIIYDMEYIKKQSLWTALFYFFVHL